MNKKPVWTFHKFWPQPEWSEDQLWHSYIKQVKVAIENAETDLSQTAKENQKKRWNFQWHGSGCIQIGEWIQQAHRNIVGKGKKEHVHNEMRDVKAYQKDAEN